MSSENKLSYNIKNELKEPKMYTVTMHNDDYTTMQFVVEILIKIFHKSSVEASSLMMKIHQTGSAVVGTYTYDIAATKKIAADNIAEINEFPLKITIDEAI